MSLALQSRCHPDALKIVVIEFSSVRARNCTCTNISRGTKEIRTQAVNIRRALIHYKAVVAYASRAVQGGSAPPDLYWRRHLVRESRKVHMRRGFLHGPNKIIDLVRPAVRITLLVDIHITLLLANHVPIPICLNHFLERHLSKIT